MEEKIKSCLLCLKKLEKNESSISLAKNKAVLQNLRLVLLPTCENLNNTESALICAACDVNLQKLAAFKASTVSNDLKLQTNKADLTAFLKTFSVDVNKICRLCFSKSNEPLISLNECLDILGQCYVYLNDEVTEPGNVCFTCQTILEDLLRFITMFNDNKSAQKSKKAVTKTYVRRSLKKPNSFHIFVVDSQASTSKDRSESIDLPPLENVNDITLGVDTNGLVKPYTAPVVDNGTQELINILEGTYSCLEEDANDVTPKKASKKKESALSEQMEHPKEVPNEKTTPIKQTEGCSSESAEADVPKDATSEETTSIEQPDNCSSQNADSDEDPDSREKPDKPFKVTIIRRKTRRSNKVELEKTWKELVGGETKEAKKNGNNKEPAVAAATGAATATPVEAPKKRRGRPPLPGKEKKAKKEKPVYYSCPSCNFKSISNNMFVQHMFIHNVVSDMGPFKCDVCSFTATTEEILLQHKSRHSVQNQTYHCLFCDYKASKKVSAMNHTLHHDDKDIINMFYCMLINEATEEELFECFQCTFQSSDEATMPDHVIEHRSETIRNPLLAKFQCTQCKYRTKFEDMLRRHIAQHEKEEESDRKKGKKIKKEEEGGVSQGEEEEMLHKCPDCDYVTHYKRSLVNHQSLKHKHPRKTGHRVPPGEVYYCNECPYTTYRKQNLPRHALVHKTKENMEFFECAHCLFETKHRRSYVRHMETKHKIII